MCGATRNFFAGASKETQGQGSAQCMSYTRDQHFFRRKRACKVSIRPVFAAWVEDEEADFRASTRSTIHAFLTPTSHHLCEAARGSARIRFSG